MSWARTLVSEMATTSTDGGRPTVETRSYKEEIALGLTVISDVEVACGWLMLAGSFLYDGEGVRRVQTNSGLVGDSTAAHASIELILERLRTP